jgi:hypothetical protein
MDDANEEISMLLYKLDTATTDLEVLSCLLNQYGAGETKYVALAADRLQGQDGNVVRIAAA